MSTRSLVNATNGYVSAIVLACGIILSILIALLYGKLLDAADQSPVTVSNSSVPLETKYSRAITNWVVGFTFIIPGCFGILASFVMMKHGYILQLVLFIIALCISLALHAGTISDVSIDRLVALNVSCPGFTSCEEADAIVNMGIGAGVMVVLGWIFILLCIVMAVYLIFQHKKLKRMVYRNPPVPALWNQYPKQPIGYSPQPLTVSGIVPYGPKPISPYRQKSRGYQLKIVGSYPASSVQVAQNQYEILPRLQQPRPVLQPATNMAYVDDYDEIPLDNDQPINPKLAHLKNEPKFSFNPVRF